MKVQLFVHPPSHQEVHAIGGYYQILREAEMLFQGRRVLYLLCQANLDNTCCGVGGGSYIQVAGFVLRGRFAHSPEGMLISEVEPIRQPEVQKAIREAIKKGENIEQIYFM